MYKALSGSVFLKSWYISREYSETSIEIYTVKWVNYWTSRGLSFLTS